MKKAFWLLPAVILLMGLAVAVACGGDDSGSNGPTDTDAAATDDPDASPVETTKVTPRPDTGRECGFGDQDDLRLLSHLEFGGDRPAHYAPGEDVPMTLVIENCTGVDIELFYEGEARFDFSIEDAIGQEIWRWTEEQELSDEPGELTILPQEIVEYSVTWDQRDFNDERAEPGIYKVFAFSLGCGMEGATDCRFGPVELLEITE